MAKTYDRFGWDRDRGTPTQDAQITNWMNALQDYPIDEVRKACCAAILETPERMPNQGHIVRLILKARRAHVQSLPKPVENVAPVSRVSAHRAAEIMREAGIAVKRVPQ